MENQLICWWKTTRICAHLEINISRWLILTITVCNCFVTTESYIEKNRNGVELEKNGAKVNHLLFMDDLKLYRKNDKEIHSLIKTVW